MPDNHELIKIYLYVYLWEKNITLIPNNNLSEYLLSLYDAEFLISMITNFKRTFMFIAPDLRDEVWSLFIVMQQVNPSIEDTYARNLAMWGEIPATDYCRVEFRFISFYLTYIREVYPDEWEQLIRALERIEDTQPEHLVN